jgi:hypothetical protein
VGDNLPAAAGRYPANFLTSGRVILNRRSVWQQASAGMPGNEDQSPPAQIRPSTLEPRNPSGKRGFSFLEILTNYYFCYITECKPNHKKEVGKLNFTIDESTFEATLKEKLGDQYERALGIFRKIGSANGLDLIQIFIHTHEQNQTAKIISELEKFAKTNFHSRYEFEEMTKALENAKKELGI